MKKQSRSRVLSPAWENFKFTLIKVLKYWLLLLRPQHNDTQYKKLTCDTQHEDNQRKWHSAWQCSAIMLNVIMLSVVFYWLLCWVPYAECQYVECLYAECRGPHCFNPLSFLFLPNWPYNSFNHFNHWTLQKKWRRYQRCTIWHDDIQLCNAHPIDTQHQAKARLIAFVN
jgi:hypothetical protein